MTSASEERLTRRSPTRTALWPYRRASRQARATALRVLNATRESAVHACTQATNAVHALVVGAPEQVRDRLRDLSTTMLLRRCAAMKVMPGSPVDVRATVTALQSAARRAIALDAEANELQRAIGKIVNDVAPELIAERGVGPITGAVVFCAWSHPGRYRNEAAFASLAGVAPIPASSGQTVRYRLNRRGDRQLNRALHTFVTTRLRDDPDTIAYVARRTAEGKTKPEIRRCLKRYVARDLYRILQRTAAASSVKTCRRAVGHDARCVHLVCTWRLAGSPASAENPQFVRVFPWAMGASIPRPPPCEGGALPTELNARNCQR
jgi:transposase